MAEVDANGLALGLNGREPSGAQGEGGPVVTFQPEGSLEETVSNLKEQGVEVPAEISEHPWGRVATFKDSEGNDIQLYEAPESRAVSMLRPASACQPLRKQKAEMLKC